MTTMKAAIPVLPVSDPEQAAAFYQERLGFTLVYANEGYVVLSRDEIQIHLWVASDSSWEERMNNPAHAEAGRPLVTGAETFLAGTASCRVLVDDIEPLHETYKAEGVVHPNGPLGDKPYGLREFSILDRDNNLITFFRPILSDDPTS